MNELSVFGNIPVQTAAIASAYPTIKAGNKKVAMLENANRIIRLKRGLYVVNPEETGKLLSTELIGNLLYGPSYVSMLTALRFYGLIPERVDVVQSMTTHSARSYENAVGRFDYFHCSKAYYPIGIQQVSTDGVTFLMASPEKALCDYICHTPKLPLRFVKDVHAFLEEDLRLDMEQFAAMDARIFRECAAVGKKRHAIENLIKILESGRKTR